MSVLKSLGRSDDLLSDSYVDDVMEKLPVSLRTKWIDSTKDRPGRRNLESLAEWLEDRAHTWDIVQGIADSSRIKAEGKPSYPKPRSYAADATSLVASCPFHFKRGHRVEQCRMFKRLQPPERFKLMQEKGLCFACFGKHLRSDCKVNIRCPLSGCNGRHHPLLHEINVRGNRHREAAPSDEIQNNPGTQASITTVTSAVGEIATAHDQNLQSPSTREQMLPHSACAEIACQVAHQIVPVYLYGESGQKLKTLLIRAQIQH